MDQPEGKDFKTTYVDVEWPSSPGEDFKLSADPVWLQTLGLAFDVQPQSRTFKRWRPDPWTVIATDKTPLCTLSNFNLTIIKAAVQSTGEVVTTYLLHADTKTEGWQIRPLFPENSGCRFTIAFLDANHGTVWEEGFTFEMRCDTNRNQVKANRIYLDVFDLIRHARISVAEQYFYPCG